MYRTTIFFLLLFISKIAIAWPLFTVPSIQDIERASQAKACEKKSEQFKISKNAIIPADFIGNMKPSGWYWTSKKESPCFQKNQNLPIRNIKITQERDNDGTTLFSVIQAHLQAPNGEHFTLSLKTPQENWDCHLEKQAPNYIVCANDM